MMNLLPVLISICKGISMLFLMNTRWQKFLSIYKYILETGLNLNINKHDSKNGKGPKIQSWNIIILD